MNANDSPARKGRQNVPGVPLISFALDDFQDDRLIDTNPEAKDGGLCFDRLLDQEIPFPDQLVDTTSQIGQSVSSR